MKHLMKSLALFSFALPSAALYTWWWTRLTITNHWAYVLLLGLELLYLVLACNAARAVYLAARLLRRVRLLEQRLRSLHQITLKLERMSERLPWGSPEWAVVGRHLADCQAASQLYYHITGHHYCPVHGVLSPEDEDSGLCTPCFAVHVQSQSSASVVN